MAGKIAPLSEDRRAEAVQLMCAWAVSSQSHTAARVEVTRLAVAVHLLRRLAMVLLARAPAVAPQPLESALMHFLDTHIPATATGTSHVLFLFLK